MGRGRVKEVKEGFEKSCFIRESYDGEATDFLYVRILREVEHGLEEGGRAGEDGGTDGEEEFRWFDDG